MGRLGKVGKVAKQKIVQIVLNFEGKFANRLLQKALRDSVSGTNRHQLARTGTNWHEPARTGTFRHELARFGTFRHSLFERFGH